MPKAFHAMALLVISCDLVATVKVIVVGAGTSGLAAARTLIDTWDATANGGPLELTVLEAGTRIGGRVWTLNADEAGAAWATAGALGAPTDMGASWIHGSTSTHPITKIATALNETSGLVQTNDDLAELHLCTAGQTSACSEPRNDRYAAYESLLERAQEKGETDMSLWQALSGLSRSGQTRDSALFQYHLAVSTEFNTAGPADRLSAWNYDDDSQYSGTELVWARGYKVMYEALQSGAVRVNDGSSTLEVFAVASASRQPISVTYSKRVTSVTYSSTGVVLTTADSSTYNADYVIITIPLGVLKSTDASSRVTFNPALPPATVNGISQLGFGNVVKVALLFPTAWWPSGMHYYGLAQGTNRGLFTYFLNVHELSAKPVLMTFALGASADTAEQMSDAAVWTQVWSPLPLPQISRAFPAGATSAPLTISHNLPRISPLSFPQIRANLVKIMPSDVTIPMAAPQMIRSTWRANPHAKGAYTFVAVGALSTNPSLPQLPVPFSDLPSELPRVLVSWVSWQVLRRTPSRPPLMAMSEGDFSLQASTLRRYTEEPSTARSSLARCASPRASLDLPRASSPLISHASPLHTSPPTCVSLASFRTCSESGSRSQGASHRGWLGRGRRGRGRRRRGRRARGGR